MPVIDIHPHIVSPDTKQYPLAPAWWDAIHLVKRAANYV
jgi:hypothetical protein